MLRTSQKCIQIIWACFGISALGATAFAADAPPPSELAKQLGLALYRLDAFGKVDSAPAAEATYRKALAQLTADNGGILVVPEAVSQNAHLENVARWSHSIDPSSNKLRDWKVGPGVLVIDNRQGTTVIRVPQLADTRTRGGLVLNRTLRLPEGDSLQHWTEEAVASIENDVIHGACNYLDWIVAPVSPGPDARFYVPQVRNLFHGMYLNAHEGPSYQGRVERITVKDIGYDAEKKLHYFTAHANFAHKAGAIVQNKSHTPALRIKNNYNAANQTFDVFVERNHYANGDAYMFNGTFNYMGNVHSMAGDENGNVYVAYIRSLGNIFRAQVEALPQPSKLVFARAKNAHTLANSRPLINLNPDKWITAGKVWIVPAESYWENVDTGKYPFEGKTYPTQIAPYPGSGIKGLRMGGLIRASADAPWDERIIGRFFAVNTTSEHVPLPKTKDLRRWYEITDLIVHGDGRKDITIKRVWWGAKIAGSPTLYDPENYSYDGHLRPLSYIIAPGAYVNNLSQAVGSERERAGRVPFTLGITPHPDSGGPLDFAPGDPIEQAIGADPFKPQAFRGWTFDAVPGAWPSAMVELANHGKVARSAAFKVQGGPATMAGVAQRADRQPPWLSVLEVNSVVQQGVTFNADVGHAALYFKQPNAAQPLVWAYGKADPGQSRAEARLTVTQDYGNLVFDGGHVHAKAGLVTTGISGDAIASRNLRGKHVAVKQGSRRVEVSLPAAEADAEYAVFVEQSWLSNRAVTQQTATGFSVEFSEPAPAAATLHWLLVR